ncbi:MAG TPA: TonB-dependent receptor [Gemmatimonadaceae bacterium]|nr:TonB-dependent receptor [Gemmatimonadaceae bacterium]
MSRPAVRTVLTLLVSVASTAIAQRPVQQSADSAAARSRPLAAVTITATRSQRSTFDTPQAITVLDSSVLRAKLPHGAVDLFRDIAGLDASGVGPSQRRPEIRGMRGQRILLLEDGLRLNNSRRQQDFGELPAVAGISDLDRVEVVRGPSSVLYGTDAIGGVVNIISPPTPSTPSGEVHGDATYRYGSAGSASTPNGAIMTRFGNLGVRASAAYRDANAYRAAKGSFGDITLADEEEVFDSGIRDQSYSLMLGYDLQNRGEVFSRAEWYKAGQAGFGFIDPAKLGQGQPRVQILYPDQDYSRYTVGYRASALSTFFATRAEVSTYLQRNERHLNNYVLVPAGPGATIDSKSYNFTDLATVGGRIELARPILSRAVLTYGVDAFRDRSNNTDSSRTIITGFGPPTNTANSTPAVPNATFRSAGAFTQLELEPLSRLTTVLGLRGQDIVAETRPTPGVTRPLIKGTNRTLVWNANALYRLTQDLNVIGTIGRGFRSPNLVERFFEGNATEANSFQRANPDLGPETSLNTDLGLRFRRNVYYAEGFVFRNDVHDAIKGVATGGTVNGRPEFQNHNIGRLRVDGMELTTGVHALSGVDASASFTRVDGKNISDPNNPIGDSYSSKLVGDIAYSPWNGRLSVGYTLRYQGEQKEVIVGTNPIGDKLPAFAVHSARASVRLFDRRGLSNSLALTVDNIGDKLYAEFPNASFFRPEPGRSVSLAIFTSF